MNPFSSGKLRRRLLLLSPLVVIAIGHLTAVTAGKVMGVWAWIPLTLVFWTALALLIIWSGGKQAFRRWLQRPQGSRGWSFLAVAVGFIPLPLFLMHWQLLKPATIWVPWLAFALINPWLEEGYWRGVLLDAVAHWPKWAGVLYTSALFAASHPAMWGVNSIANRTPEVVVSTFLMGIAWAIAYQKTGSLRWAIASHVLVDLLNLSVAVFVNLFVPRSFW